MEHDISSKHVFIIAAFMKNSTVLNVRFTVQHLLCWKSKQLDFSNL